jgi:phosphosulfolactate phosphohydrolase-like enzyme
VQVDVAFTPDEAVAAAPLAIVVDVLRATSSIAQALATGYERVLCAAEIDDARRLRKTIPDSLVGGERDARRIDGFDASFPSALAGLNARTYGPPGLEKDIAFCARESVLDVVPRLSGTVDGAAEIVA